MLSDIENRFPLLEIDYFEATAPDLLAALRRQQVDCCLLLTSNIEHNDDLMDVGVVTSAGQPLSFPAQRLREFLRSLIVRLESTIELWSIESIKKCVASNLGISFLPRFTVLRELESGELRELPLSSSPLSITALCAHHAGRTVSPAMKAFIDCMHQCLGQQTPAPQQLPVKYD